MDHVSDTGMPESTVRDYLATGDNRIRRGGSRYRVSTRFPELSEREALR